MTGPRPTHHAIKRLRQRLGIKRKAALAETKRAFERSLWGEDIPTTIRMWLEGRTSHGPHAAYSVTPSTVYIWEGEVLITVLQLPPEFRNDALNAWKSCA